MGGKCPATHHEELELELGHAAPVGALDFQVEQWVFELPEVRDVEENLKTRSALLLSGDGRG